jgi:hypothetical protein
MSNIEDIINWTLDKVEDIPEEYRVAAFKVLLKYKLFGRDNPCQDPESLIISEQKETTDNSDDWRSKLIKELPHAHIIAEKGNRKQQALWAVIHSNKIGDEANTNSVVETIKKKLAITPETVDNTSWTLKKLTPKYITREDRDEGL